MTPQISQEQLCREIARRFSITRDDAKKLRDMVCREAYKINNNGYRGDLENIGWIEVLKTLDTSDLTRGAKPSTCCYWPIRKAMIRAMQQESSRKKCQRELSDDIVDNSLLQDEKVLKQEQVQILRGCVEKLPEPLRMVLNWRFGLEGEETLTLEKIGERLTLSKQRIKQIEEEGIGALRKLFQEHGLLHG